MSEEERKALDKEVKRLRRIAGEWQQQLHDLCEERLPMAYQELPGIAQSTFNACKAWAEAEKALKAALPHS